MDGTGRLEEVRELDHERNAETTPPDGEHVDLCSIWATEFYTPGQMDTLRNNLLRFEEETLRSMHTSWDTRSNLEDMLRSPDSGPLGRSRDLDTRGQPDTPSDATPGGQTTRRRGPRTGKGPCRIAIHHCGRGLFRFRRRNCRCVRPSCTERPSGHTACGIREGSDTTTQLTRKQKTSGRPEKRYRPK